MQHNVLIVPFEPWHLTGMKSRPEQMSEQKFLEETYGIEQYGESLRIGSVSSGTALVGGKVVASAGVFQTQPHMGDCWAFFSEDFPFLGRKDKIVIVRELQAKVKATGLSRVQATCEAGFKVAESFLERLGMEFEGVLRAYGADKTDYKMYSYIGDTNE